MNFNTIKTSADIFLDQDLNFTHRECKPAQFTDKKHKNINKSELVVQNNIERIGPKFDKNTSKIKSCVDFTMDKTNTQFQPCERSQDGELNILSDNSNIQEDSAHFSIKCGQNKQCTSSHEKKYNLTNSNVGFKDNLSIQKNISSLETNPSKISLTQNSEHSKYAISQFERFDESVSLEEDLICFLNEELDYMIKTNSSFDVDKIFEKTPIKDQTALETYLDINKSENIFDFQDQNRFPSKEINCASNCESSQSQSQDIYQVNSNTRNEITNIVPSPEKPNSLIFQKNKKRTLYSTNDPYIEAEKELFKNKKSIFKNSLENKKLKKFKKGIDFQDLQTLCPSSILANQIKNNTSDLNKRPFSIFSCHNTYKTHSLNLCIDQYFSAVSHDFLCIILDFIDISSDLSIDDSFVIYFQILRKKGFLKHYEYINSKKLRDKLESYVKINNLIFQKNYENQPFTSYYSLRLCNLFKRNNLCLCFLQPFYSKGFTLIDLGGYIHICDEIFIHENQDAFELWTYKNICSFFKFLFVTHTHSKKQKIPQSKKYQYKKQSLWFLKQFENFIIYRKSCLRFYRKNFGSENPPNIKKNPRGCIIKDYEILFLPIFTFFRKLYISELAKNQLKLFVENLEGFNFSNLINDIQNLEKNILEKFLIKHTSEIYKSILKRWFVLLERLINCYFQDNCKNPDIDILFLIISHFIKYNQSTFTEYFSFLLSNKINQGFPLVYIIQSVQKRFFMDENHFNLVQNIEQNFANLSVGMKMNFLLNNFFPEKKNLNDWLTFSFTYFLKSNIIDVVYNSFLGDTLIFLYEKRLFRQEFGFKKDLSMLKNIFIVLVKFPSHSKKQSFYCNIKISPAYINESININRFLHDHY